MESANRLSRGLSAVYNAQQPTNAAAAMSIPASGQMHVDSLIGGSIVDERSDGLVPQQQFGLPVSIPVGGSSAVQPTPGLAYAPNDSVVSNAGYAGFGQPSGRVVHRNDAARRAGPRIVGGHWPGGATYVLDTNNVTAQQYAQLSGQSFMVSQLKGQMLTSGTGVGATNVDYSESAKR